MNWICEDDRKPECGSNVLIAAEPFASQGKSGHVIRLGKYCKCSGFSLSDNDKGKDSFNFNFFRVWWMYVPEFKGRE